MLILLLIFLKCWQQNPGMTTPSNLIYLNIDIHVTQTHICESATCEDYKKEHYAYFNCRTCSEEHRGIKVSGLEVQNTKQITMTKEEGEKRQKVSTNLEEKAYLSLCERIIEEGEHRPDRTGTGTSSIFAPPQLRFSLKDDTFPLLTTKKVFTKGIILELLWFVKGFTDSKILSKQGVKIWDGNGSREFLDKLGLKDRREGDLGPVYGFQWRHFGAEYKDCDTDYTGQGYDQLAEVILKLKTNPYDRRIIMSAWNPPDFAKMALPPCHVFSQFYVNFPKEGKPQLSCLLYQRSCDMGLGVPFNIASYALLTKMIAHVVDMDCGEFIHTLGDAHVYNDHVEALREQIQREPYEFPKLKIKRDVKNIDDFQYEDFEIIGYKSHPKIAMKMSV